MPSDGLGEVHRFHAATCIMLAQKTDDPQSKIALLDMARAWLALADQHDKNSRITLIYETPEPHRQVAQQQQQPQPKKE
jgi:hypothetical protein